MKLYTIYFFFASETADTENIEMTVYRIPIFSRYVSLEHTIIMNFWPQLI